MSKILEEVLKANEAYVESFGDKSKLATPPARQFAILTCMDARLDPAKYAGLAEGDAHVIRNAGGRASDDAIRSLIISNKLLGTREWFVIHHTDCGMAMFTEDTIRTLHASSTETATIGESDWHDSAEGQDSAEELFDWLAFEDGISGLVEDVQRIRNHRLVPPDIPIYAFVYDVRSGRLIEVPEASAVDRSQSTTT